MLFFTETNFTSDNEGAHTPNNGLQGGYLADLQTWMYNHYCKFGPNKKCGIDPSTTPVRIAWFNGADSPDGFLGLFNGGISWQASHVPREEVIRGQKRSVLQPYGPIMLDGGAGTAKSSPLPHCRNPGVGKYPTTAGIYRYLRDGGCPLRP